MRFYLVHDGGILDDADYSNYHIISRYKHSLSGQLGNLASRVTRAKGWSVRNAVQTAKEEGWGQNGPAFQTDSDQWRELMDCKQNVSLQMDQYKVGAALRAIM